MSAVTHVGMADLVSVRHPATLVTLGLGSCIGLVIFDPSTKVAAMAHIMLPDSRDAKEVPKPGKFADTAVPLLLEHLKNLGAVKGQLKAKMAGGAQMFNIPGKDNSLLAVGSRNVEATTAMLAKHGVPLVASDVGGNKGRSVEFNTETWKLLVKTLGTGSQEL
ncbi:chemotaxis protein CheD [Aminomonas paucivorans]|uniref:Probable chemoreceptor glutamine deamidase CheD n=1 Tax=Aminomonas paucivorans DSM 12260 TaxID=584708 RepID=E3CVV2_9BACT|nr:CheD, stimulates methylation of MCP proteins [Aminomonas paucivorans DSM 12260]